MKLVKQANGKPTIKMSKSEWLDMGKKAGWMNQKKGRPISDDDKNAPIYKAILDPTLRANFTGMTEMGWNDMEEKVRKGISPFSTSSDNNIDRTMSWD